MKEGKGHHKRRLIIGGIVLVLVVFAGFQFGRLKRQHSAGDLRMYDYRDTRRLVSLTDRAADLVGKKGEVSRFATLHVR